MEYSDKYVAIKNNFTGLFWDGEKFILPKNRLDVFSCAIDEEDFDADLKTIPEDLRNECILTVIEIVTQLIY